MCCAPQITAVDLLLRLGGSGGDYPAGANYGKEDASVHGRRQKKEEVTYRYPSLEPVALIAHAFGVREGALFDWIYVQILALKAAQKFPVVEKAHRTDAIERHLRPQGVSAADAQLMEGS